MKIALVQMNIEFGSPEKNFLQVQNYIEKAAAEKTDVIVFPEMWNTGYALTELDRLADENGDKTKKLFSQLAEKYSVNIVGGSVSTKKDIGYYNTMYVANRFGEIVGEYDKVH
jgi:predicted amidohydrolase